MYLMHSSRSVHVEYQKDIIALVHKINVQRFPLLDNQAWEFLLDFNVPIMTSGVY